MIFHFYIDYLHLIRLESKIHNRFFWIIFLSGRTPRKDYLVFIIFQCLVHFFNRSSSVILSCIRLCVKRVHKWNWLCILIAPKQIHLYHCVFDVYYNSKKSSYIFKLYKTKKNSLVIISIITCCYWSSVWFVWLLLVSWKRLNPSQLLVNCFTILLSERNRVFILTTEFWKPAIYSERPVGV